MNNLQKVNIDGQDFWVAPAKKNSPGLVLTGVAVVGAGVSTVGSIIDVVGKTISWVGQTIEGAGDSIKAWALEDEGSQVATLINQAENKSESPIHVDNSGVATV